MRARHSILAPCVGAVLLSLTIACGGGVTEVDDTNLNVEGTWRLTLADTASCAGGGTRIGKLVLQVDELSYNDWSGSSGLLPGWSYWELGDQRGEVAGLVFFSEGTAGIWQFSVGGTLQGVAQWAVHREGKTLRGVMEDRNGAAPLFGARPCSYRARATRE